MLSVNTDKTLTVTILEESMNIHNSETIIKELKDAALNNTGDEFVIDFRNVLSIDSSAIAMLVGFVQVVAGVRKKLLIVNAKHSVRNAIKLLNLTQFLNLK